MMTLPRFLRVVGPSLFIILWFACGVVGQTETATISGLVTDRTVAAVSGAEVRLQSVERGTVTTTSTNDAGIYVFPSVQPGQYQISVQKQGFKQVDLLGLIVNVQDHIEQNFRLQLGSVAESVTVNANDMHLNTTDATVSTVIDRQFAENLPLNGRSFQTLIELTPGVVVVPTTSFDSGQFSVNGQRTASNYWMVDGVSANTGISAAGGNLLGNGPTGTAASFTVLGGTNSLVSVDAMQEFKIQTSTYAPEFGRTPGAQISIVTRSGTNQFHGTGFDYFRNDALDANDWFNNFVTPALPKAKERQNDFGGTFSGPLIKNRTFFFFSYEGLRLRLPQTTLTTVPDLATRQAAIPVMQPYLNAYPLPTGPEVLAANGSPTGAAQFNSSYSNPASLDAYSLRIDHKLTDKWGLYGRYNYSPSSLLVRGGSSSALSIVQPISATSHTGTMGVTWIVSPRIANDFRFNYSTTDSSSSFRQDNFGGAVQLTSLPFPSPFTASNGLLAFLPLSLQQGELAIGQFADLSQHQINVVDGLSAQKGLHNLKVGVDFRQLSPQIALFEYELLPQFTNVATASAGTLRRGTVAANFPSTFRFRNLSAYAQDTWRVIPRLTFTYGLRWDVDFVPEATEGQNYSALANFDQSNLSAVTLAPVGTSPYRTGYGNVAPRIGIAYQVSQSQNWETVIRGGFGVFYDIANSQGNFREGYPFKASGRFSTFPPSPPPPVPLSSPVTQGVDTFDPNLKQPYTLEWNVAVEQGVGQRQSISVSYVGAAGRRLLQSAVVFNPNPSLAHLVFITNAGTSDYDALQAQFQRHLVRRLQAIASYTWSHSLDTASTGSVGGNQTFYVNNLVPGSNPNVNRGPSDFDIRHAFSAALTYEVPAPAANILVNSILRGWSLQSLILARSAPPVDISDQNFFLFNGGVLADTRPDLVPGQPLYLYGRQYPGGKAFNPNAFTDPPLDPQTGNPLRQGTTPRNFVRGFGATQWDLAIHREFPIHEVAKLQFRAEMFNVLNHPNFGLPSGQFGLGGFGISSQMLGQSLNQGSLGGGGLSPLYQIGGPRSIQFALKLLF